mmetsp:Transcript_29434/g.47852  ORF Transcript_29434/g.47852 Transcript_29434/m.47852 type:complete len:333 (+) Transcript_29434:1619-2617(+)
MEELLDGRVRVREEQRGHLVVLRGLAVEADELLHQHLLLLGVGLHVHGPGRAVPPEQRQQVRDQRDRQGHQQALRHPPAHALGDIAEAPDGEALVGGVEERPNQAAHAPDHHEEQQLPHRVVGAVLVQRVELAEGEHLGLVGLQPHGLRVLDHVQRHHRHHRAEERAPRQLRGPEGGALLEREEHAADGGPEGGRHPRRGAARDEVAFLLVVAEVLELGEGGVQAEGVALPLGDAGGQHGAAVHHGALLPRGQPARHREHHAQHLADEGADTDDPFVVHPVQEGLDFRNTRPCAERLKVNHEGSDEHEEHIETRIGQKGCSRPHKPSVFLVE